MVTIVRDGYKVFFIPDLLLVIRSVFKSGDYERDINYSNLESGLTL